MYGSKWTILAKSFLGRSDNDVKNRFYSTLRRVATKKFRDDPHSTGKAISQVKSGLLQFLDEAAEHGHTCSSKRGRRKKLGISVEPVHDHPNPNPAPVPSTSNYPKHPVVSPYSREGNEHGVLALPHIVRSESPIRNSSADSKHHFNDAQSEHRCEVPRRDFSENPSANFNEAPKENPCGERKKRSSVAPKASPSEEREEDLKEKPILQENQRHNPIVNPGTWLGRPPNHQMRRMPWVPMMSCIQPLPFAIRPISPILPAPASWPVFGWNMSLPRWHGAGQEGLSQNLRFSRPYQIQSVSKHVLLQPQTEAPHPLKHSHGS